MGEAIRFVLAAFLVAIVVTGGASVGGWWLSPTRRTARVLARRLGARPDAVAVSPEQGRGVAICAGRNVFALVRFPGDPGLLRPLSEVRGVELMLDGEVRARAFRGEGRRPLDRIVPSEGGRVTLRLALDDLAEPTFELDLHGPGDRPRPGRNAPLALEEARAAYARFEAVVQRGVT